MMLHKGMKLRTKGFDAFNDALYEQGKLDKHFPRKLLIKDGEILEIVQQKSFYFNDWIVKRENGKEQSIGGSLLEKCEIVNGLPEDLFNV